MSLVATDRYDSGYHATRDHQPSTLGHFRPHVEGFSLLRERALHATVHGQQFMSPSGKQLCKL